MSSDAKLSLDHVIPEAAGGATCIDNLVTACMSCNQFKGSRTPEECGLPWPSDVTGKRYGSVTNLLQKPLPEKRRDREESILNNNNPPTKLKLDVSELDNIDPRAKQSILEWIEYKTSIKKPMKQPALKKLLKSSPQAIITAVDASIMNGYQGLFPEKYESKQQQYTAPSRDLTKPTMS
jgi:hypothetical protein